MKTPVLMKIVVHTSHPLGEEKLRKLSTLNTSIEYNIKVFYPFSNHRLKEVFPKKFPGQKKLRQVHESRDCIIKPTLIFDLAPANQNPDQVTIKPREKITHQSKMIKCIFVGCVCGAKYHRM